MIRCCGYNTHWTNCNMLYIRGSIYIFLLIPSTIFAKVNLNARHNGEYQSKQKVVGDFAWTKDAFVNDECKNEHQPVVEYYYLNGMQYLFFSERVTWEEARLLCPKYNAKLAILDSMEKAVGVAEAIADSNIVMEDTWLAGRRVDFIWTWVDDQDGTWKKNEIPMDSDIDEYPPWSREPTRPTKECLAMDRRAHSMPNFIDLDCRLQRPFICAKKPEEAVKTPVPSRWINVNKNTYSLYHARVTWHEAAGFCRSQGMRLAVVKNPSVIDILTKSMTKARPDFETAWIGAHFSYGQWVWMATGAILNSITDDSGYPPWRFGRPQRNEGCLLLDRHIEKSISFVETSCDRKRDFICEEYAEDEEDDWLNEPVKFTHENSTYIIYPMDKTWNESRTFCSERGSVLAYVNNMNTTNLIIEAMGDHPREISHIWMGGFFHTETNIWKWKHNENVIPIEKDSDGFPPWALVDLRSDYKRESSTCLNLDRSDHVKPHFYGLDCNSKQPFVCKIKCEDPPPVKNGTWTCATTSSGKECFITCQEGTMIMGIKNIICTIHSGWTSRENWLEFPLCVESKEYTTRMIHSLNYEIQRSVGYYIILDHSNLKMRSISLSLTERLQTAFPVNNDLKMGMISQIVSPPIHIPLNQSDTCNVLQIIQEMQSTLATNITASNEINATLLYNDIWMYNGQKTLIIAILDSTSVNYTADVLTQLKLAGHYVAIIGLRDDWELLTPLATIGLNNRANVFLFDIPELMEIIQELYKIKKKATKCEQRITTVNKLEQDTATVPVEMHARKMMNNISSLTNDYFDKNGTVSSPISNMDVTTEYNASPLINAQSNESTTKSSTTMELVSTSKDLPQEIYTQVENNRLVSTTTESEVSDRRTEFSNLQLYLDRDKKETIEDSTVSITSLPKELPFARIFSLSDATDQTVESTTSTPVMNDSEKRLYYKSDKIIRKEQNKEQTMQL
ncbi:uncharacterized protein LOC107264003 isoform X2 [Cephus cinctus]|uniref:Uncharacterized protein LOC107264003 isoform X2 n=1 Tax=Cephus cinctus TaxID=211228 RepID=A0AAJ7BK38_CEPCN|nr:uncharacterized protein LOC107264003 isoform X2 [Cephus cinctus]